MNASPDFLDSSPKDMKRVNKRPYMIAIMFFVVAALLMGTGVVQMIDGPFAERKEMKEEERVFAKTALPPVKREDIPKPRHSPDIAPPPAPVQPAHLVMPESVRRQMEIEKEAREAPSAVAVFANRRDDQQQPYMQQNRPDQRSRNDPNMQDEKREFLNEASTESPYLLHTRTDPIAPGMEVTPGTIIPGIMVTGVNSDLPGEVIGQVAENVYDSATGRNLLIPAGSKIKGIYDSRVSFGQERVLMAWTEIWFPDGSHLLMDRMPGADVSGFAGMTGNVNNHYWKVFGNAMLLSLFSAASQLSQPQAAVSGTYNSQQIMAAAMGREINMMGRMLIQRNLNIQPTIQIPQFQKFSILVTKAMVFDRVWER